MTYSRLLRGKKGQLRSSNEISSFRSSSRDPAMLTRENIHKLSAELLLKAREFQNFDFESIERLEAEHDLFGLGMGFKAPGGVRPGAGLEVKQGTKRSFGLDPEKEREREWRRRLLELAALNRFSDEESDYSDDELDFEPVIYSPRKVDNDPALEFSVIRHTDLPNNQVEHDQKGEDAATDPVEDKSWTMISRSHLPEEEKGD